VRRDPKGELPAHPEQVFTLGIDDAMLTMRRHTVDLRVGLASAGAAPSFASATGVAVSLRASPRTTPGRRRS
jgi:hypothetical protein